MKKMGRPTVMTENTIRKLEEAFIKGLSDREACLYANIGTSTLYDYCNENPEFSERKELLKEQVKMRAKINIAEKINNGDISASMWYLERKGKEDGFNLKQELAFENDVVFEIKKPRGFE